MRTRPDGTDAVVTRLGIRCVVQRRLSLVESALDAAQDRLLSLLVFSLLGWLCAVSVLQGDVDLVRYHAWKYCPSYFAR